MPRKATNRIVVHCSASRPSQIAGVKEIRAWHKARGWSDVGYHHVIRRSGAQEKGRPESAIGSHVAKYNADSVGICLEGGVAGHSLQPENNFTPAQWKALKALILRLLKSYPKAVVLGHRDFPKVAKACPCFDAIDWAAKNGLPASLNAGAAAKAREILGFAA